jgi:hypothetical protein
VHAVKGDVFYFPKGSKITFSSPTYGVGFFCGQRKVSLSRRCFVLCTDKVKEGGA